MKILSENYGLPFQEAYFDTSPDSLSAVERLKEQVMDGRGAAIYQKSEWTYARRQLTYWDGGVMFEELPHYVEDYGTAYPYSGSFIVRDATHVPLPVAAWLFLAGLFSLSGVGLRKSIHVKGHH